MTVLQLRQLLEKLPSDMQTAEVTLTLDGEVDAARVLMICPADVTDPDDEGPSVILAGSLDDYASRYAPAAPAVNLCECEDCRHERGEVTP